MLRNTGCFALPHEQALPAPLHGEHTEQILKEAGFSDEEIAAMIAEKAVKQYGK